jgi:hypothetical protein
LAVSSQRRDILKNPSIPALVRIIRIGAKGQKLVHS